MRDFASKNAVQERMWVLCGGIELPCKCYAQKNNKECNQWQYVKNNDRTIELFKNYPARYNLDVICLFPFVWHPVGVNKPVVVARTVDKKRGTSIL